MVFGFGTVIFLAGLISFLIHGDTSGRRILLTVGGFLFIVGVLLGIAVLRRVRLEEREWHNDLHRNIPIVDMTSKFASANISAEVNSLENSGAFEVPPSYEEAISLG